MHQHPTCPCHSGLSKAGLAVMCRASACSDLKTVCLNQWFSVVRALFLPRIEDLPRCVPTEEQPTLPIGSAGGAAAGTLTVDDPVEFLGHYCSIIWNDRAHEIENYHIELRTPCGVRGGRAIGLTRGIARSPGFAHYSGAKQSPSRYALRWGLPRMPVGLTWGDFAPTIPVSLLPSLSPHGGDGRPPGLRRDKPGQVGHDGNARFHSGRVGRRRPVWNSQ